ncbi:flotillin-1-like [Zootermopsis nevadensis]|uniref:flotillin-1-like n=1 Tax=Zootermopsis nevadensis TaxID=136037 RepID=UPI000B8E645C|nr:flotillin-1-like [Zootermopsis nevadensis]
MKQCRSYSEHQILKTFNLPLCKTLVFTSFFRLEKLAEANRNRVILEAEAEAESVRVRGEAEAFAIEAKARAEAEQMAKKADAWKDYKEAAMVDMLLDTLPKVAAEVAAPLSQAKKITMVSSGQGEIGAAKLTGEVLSIVSRVPEVVKNLTGVDIIKSVRAA